MDLDVLAMGRGERLDLLLQMNHLWDSFRLRFVQMIHYYFAVELMLLPAVLAQVVVAVERIAEDCNCFHSHHHISAAAVAVVEDDIHRSTHLLHPELTMLKRSLRLPQRKRVQMIY